MKALARVTGFPGWYIKRQALRLGLALRLDRQPWSPREISLLEELLGKVSAATIARKLKRRESSVLMKIKYLHLSRRVREGLTMRELEECLGEDHRTIRRWIERGWLKVRVQGTARHSGNGKDIYCFRDVEILRFLKAHPQEVSLRRVNQLWFWDLVLLHGRELASSC